MRCFAGHRRKQPKSRRESRMALSVARSFSPSFLLILAGVVLNGFAVAGLDRPGTSSAQMEQTTLAQKTPEGKSTKVERIVAAIAVRALPNVPYRFGAIKA